METKVLNKLFIAILALMIVLLIVIVMVNILEEEESGVNGLTDITGAMHSFEVYHKTAGLQYANVKTSERFDDNYFEYLESIQEARDKSFLR
ncbi:MAG: hypothetical protein V1831_01115 [Candidatus Woesearchaeota archaeon]